MDEQLSLAALKLSAPHFEPLVGFLSSCVLPSSAQVSILCLCSGLLLDKLAITAVDVWESGKEVNG